MTQALSDEGVEVEDHIGYLEQYFNAMKDDDVRRLNLVQQCSYDVVPRLTDEERDAIFGGDVALEKKIAATLDLGATLESVDRNDPSDVPFWAVASLSEVVRNGGWLVHCSNEDFCSFNIGVTDIGRLGLTNYLSEVDKSDPGYNFGYEVASFMMYGMEYGRCRYGRNVYLVYVPGYVVIHHYRDQEPQAIFWGQDAEVVTPILVENGYYTVADPWYDVNEIAYAEGHSDEEDYLAEEEEFNDLDDAVAWLEKRQAMAESA